VETDDTVLLSSLSAQFPGACGLKYRHPETRTLRGVRLVEERLVAPDEGWDFDFFCTFPKNDGKRKSNDLLESSTHKTKRMDVYRRCSDLIVLGLPWKTTEEELKEHFGMYGEVVMAQIKKDLTTGSSRGFGFIRFDDYEVQKRVLSIRHVIDGRTCDVKVPNSKSSDASGSTQSGKIFVGRTTEELTIHDLREYFEKFGEVTDVFIPKPFRAFAFVTFQDPEVARTLCGEDHIIKGASVNISNANPKGDRDRDGQRMGGGGGYRGGQQGDMSQGGYGSNSNWNQQQGQGGSWNNSGGRGGSNSGSSQGSWGSQGQQQQQSWGGQSGGDWGNQGNNSGQWNYPQQGGDAGNMNCGFDPKAMGGMGAMAMPFMAALSQQLFGQMNPQQAQYGAPAAPGTTPSQQPPASNSSYPPPPPTNAQAPTQAAQPSWNSAPRHDKYSRHSYNGKTDGY